MKPALRVSVVTPSFNQGDWIEATLRSVLEQDYPHIEYLVMDGGSTDRTLDVLRQYDGRLKWVSAPDNGQSDAIARGFSQCTGDLLTWLNSDDTFAPGAVARAVDAMTRHPEAPVVYGRANFIDPAGRFIAPCAHIEPYRHHRLRHYSDFIVQPAAYFRRSAYEQVGGLDPSLHFAMDYDLWLKLAELGDFVYLPEVMANYRWFGGNKSAVGGERRLQEVARVADRHGLGGVPAFFRLEAVRHCAFESLSALRSGAWSHAGRQMGRACRAAASPRAIASLFDPQTWRIIRTGQKLRKVGSSIS